MLQFFRTLSLIEGLSLIVLLLIAMPLKYQLGHDFVFPVGMTHGLLWMLFFVVALAVSHRQQWSVLRWLVALLCSVMPFGFIYLDRQLRREIDSDA